MRLILLTACLVAASRFHGVAGVAPTDEYRDADQAQSGYLPDHNMDPAIVDSPTFCLLWNVTFNNQEQVRFSASIYTISRSERLLSLAIPYLQRALLIFQYSTVLCEAFNLYAT
jgi:hypothetical protein